MLETADAKRQDKNNLKPETLIEPVKACTLEETETTKKNIEKIPMTRSPKPETL